MDDRCLGHKSHVKNFCWMGKSYNGNVIIYMLYLLVYLKCQEPSVSNQSCSGWEENHIYKYKTSNHLAFNIIILYSKSIIRCGVTYSYCFKAFIIQLNLYKLRGCQLVVII